MSIKNRRAPEDAGEEMQAGAAVTAEETAGGPAGTGVDGPQAQEKSEELFDKLPDPCVYCGPSVRNVARQFTVYRGGLPEELKAFIREHRAARGLLTGVERFAQVRRRLETPGMGEFILFNKLRGELGKGGAE